MTQVTHRPGPFHQVNKPHHKGPKGNDATGKIPQKITKKLSRKQRLHLLKQNRALKKEKSSSLKRNIGGLTKAPLVVGWFDPSGQNYQNIIKDNLESYQIKTVDDRSAYLESSHYRFKLIQLKANDIFDTLDIVKRLDILIIIHRAGIIYDQDDQVLRAIRLYCQPTTVHLVIGNQSQFSQAKKAIKSIHKDEKILTNDGKDFSYVFQSLGNCKRQTSKFKESRSSIETDKVELIDDCLAFTGFVRNRRLSPNDLVHIVGYDDYQIAKIDVLPEFGDTPVQTLTPDLMKQQSLEQTNDLDPMEGEQTWPTAEELAEEAERLNTRRFIKKLPPGTSSYQQAWIPDEEEILDTDPDEEESDEDADQTESEDADERMDDDDEGDETNNDNEPGISDSQMYDDYDEKHGGDRYQMDCLEYKDHVQFPDEIDTPADVPARMRFARFRGLKSFRTSAWDPDENLPPDYAKIFRFKNFLQAKKNVMNEIPEYGVDPGLYVRVHVKNVAIDFREKILHTKPNVVGLLKHERKMTVMNYVVKALPEVEVPIKAKEELLFVVGFRKFFAKPILSSHTISSKFKNEKFLTNECALVATVFAPLTYPPAPVIIFKRNNHGSFDMVASGSTLDSNPNRLVIKRIRLSGHPFKIHSKSAVIRFMFHNSEDVVYFKPVELVTRYNRRGHITEPLGTHGHMKCTFDKKIRSDDCVFMNLYKRVFPKWTYTPAHNI